MEQDFLITLDYSGSLTTLACAGELDITTSPRLVDAVELCLDSNPSTFIFDGNGISLLSSSGIQALFDLAKACKERDIRLELRLSAHARKVLDIVGLWWLGLVDDGLEAEGALDDALRVYAERSLEQESRGDPPSRRPGGSEYFLG